MFALFSYLFTSNVAMCLDGITKGNVFVGHAEEFPSPFTDARKSKTEETVG